MSDFPSTARVVIIGGGAVGVSGLYHLAKAGWTDCVLLEKNELTSGSTWHAAGNCPNFSGSWAVMNMQRYSLEMYRGLADAVDYPMNYHVTGAIRLAHTKERMQEFEAWTKENGRKLPMIRDVDISYYLRQDKHGLNLGPYERNCKAHWVTPDDPMPDDFSFQLYPDDLERLEFYIEDAIGRVPLLGTQGVGRVINGPIPYAPDGLPLIGPMPGVRNAFEAHAFTFGIVQAGGAGKVLAEWITEGTTEWDMWAVDPRRYTDYTDHDYCYQKAMETYGHEYAMHFPHFEWPAGRDKKHSPIHEKLKALGAQFGAVNGWERANWFAVEGDDTSLEAAETWERDGPWEPRIREECEAVRDHVGVLDLCGFSRFKLSGDRAAAWLRTQITGALPRVGRIGLGYFSDDKGRIVTEMSVMRIADDEILLITAAAAQWHDFELLYKSLPEGLSLVDLTKDYSTLVVTGPESRTLLAGMTDADLTQPWLTHQEAPVAGQSARLVRVSFAGELGWEIHAVNANIPAIYDALIAGGAKPYGMFAMNALRLEKGYRAWKGDLSTDYTMLEGGLDRFIKWDKPDFVGKEALQLEKQRGSAKRFVTCLVDANGCDAPYMSTIWHGDQVVGETTSGGYGYRVNASIALGVVRSDLSEPGTELEVEIFGQRCKAVVQEDQPLWDPENARLRA